MMPTAASEMPDHLRILEVVCGVSYAEENSALSVSFCCFKDSNSALAFPFSGPECIETYFGLSTMNDSECRRAFTFWACSSLSGVHRAEAGKIVVQAVLSIKSNNPKMSAPV